ncbi:hypothetical protein DQ244_16925 [Blastococcus sp. TBT05-19]|uniref:hypothetical protein n=1 Tax=Blastococcus sp. TBT05-19 TaxID=2250581 RepID=UPI000DEAFFFE|nr:hypothetical protein [Blastococcus sp. TBT05-19]RBY88220.1 hypothetical protein DQ244_16925 [Blastococcus sp. TBT05-19]
MEWWQPVVAAAGGLVVLWLVLLPDVVPVLGHADDVVVGAWTLRSVVRAAGDDALVRHWPGEAGGLDVVRRLAGLTPGPGSPG